MSDTPKCEPPEKLRGVDGWHWVHLPFVAVPTPIAWMCNPDNLEREWRMPASPAFVSGESKTAQTWRYLCPAITPAEAGALRAALQRCEDACFDVQRDNVALRARQAELLAALMPFAAAADELDTRAEFMISPGDLRRARIALSARGNKS